MPKPAHPSLSPHREHQLQEVAATAGRNGLVLFVGAGINGKAIPQWGQLLTRLINRALAEASLEDRHIEAFSESLASWCRSNFDPCALASLAKGVLGAKRFRLEIQDALYGELARVRSELARYCSGRYRGQQARQKYEFLRAVAELCSLPEVRAVATFNYDSLLEIAIRQVGTRIPCSHYGTRGAMPPLETAGGEMLPIFHIHGLLSPPDAAVRDVNESAVLAYDEYFDNNADPLAWETSTPVHLLRNYCSLWLGASLKDWNMLRLLYAARGNGGAPPSYCVLSLEDARAEFGFEALRPGTSGGVAESKQAFRHRCERTYKKWRHLRDELVPYQQAAMRLQATLLEKAGAELIVAGEKFGDIPAAVGDLTRELKARRKRERKKK